MNEAVKVTFKVLQFRVCQFMTTHEDIPQLYPNIDKWRGLGKLMGTLQV